MSDQRRNATSPYDRALAALRDQQEADGDTKAAYEIGRSTDGKRTYIGVNRVASKQHNGVNLARKGLTREAVWMIDMPTDFVEWVVASLLPYLDQPRGVLDEVADLLDLSDEDYDRFYEPSGDDRE